MLVIARRQQADVAIYGNTTYDKLLQEHVDFN
jgi:hypothetical protein